MEMFAVLFIVLVGISYAQESSPLEVKFADSRPRLVTSGVPLKFVCNINRGLLFVVENIVNIVRLSDVDNTEVNLTEAGKRVGAEPNYYNVKITSISNDAISVEFDILEVRDVDEGFLICRAIESKPGGLRGEDKVEIIIQRPLDSLSLKFDKYDPITKDMVDPIEVESGQHTLTCTAEGSNPAPNEVHLYLHGKLIQGVSTEVTRMTSSNVKKFRTTITGNVQLTVLNSKQEFQCTAISPLGDNHSVKLPIKIKVYDPKIVCNNSEAYKGKRYPFLTCVVDYEGLNIKSFKYELGGNGEVQEGTQNEDFVEVTREQLSESRAKVILNLYEAKDWHFKTEFYLVAVHEDGHVTRESVRLNEIPGPGDSSSILSASVATLVISLWCAQQLLL